VLFSRPRRLRGGGYDCGPVGLLEVAPHVRCVALKGCGGPPVYGP